MNIQPNLPSRKPSLSDRIMRYGTSDHESSSDDEAEIQAQTGVNQIEESDGFSDY